MVRFYCTIVCTGTLMHLLEESLQILISQEVCREAELALARTEPSCCRAIVDIASRCPEGRKGGVEKDKEMGNV